MMMMMMRKVILTLFYLTGNEEQGWVMETQLRNGNKVTDFLPKPGSLSSPLKTAYYFAQFCFFGSKLHSFRGYYSCKTRGKEKSKSGPSKDLIKRVKHLTYNYVRNTRLY